MIDGWALLENGVREEAKADPDWYFLATLNSIWFGPMHSRRSERTIVVVQIWRMNSH